MKLLVLTPQLPYPPMQGTTLRNFYLLRELAKRHEVSLLTFLQDGDDLRDGSPLHAICHVIKTVPAPPRRGLVRRALASLTSPLPDMALRLQSEQMQCALRAWLTRESFDVVQVEGIEMAGCALELHNLSGARLVFDDHNAEYVLQRSAFQSDVKRPARWHGALYSFVQWQKLARYERLVIRAYDATAAVSDVDARALEQIASEQKIFVVPNGVDTEEFAPSAADTCSDLVFTGKMDYRPNVDAALWFANEILPRVRSQFPDARFIIVGQQPHARLRSLARRDGVVLTGRVDDVKPYIAQACVYVAPLRMGGGTRL
ncbi:MAG: glycosyltransferase, partial [Chloroflexi bacterium]|nr:glycosyltransferase [Chloroflexota bacterium]